MHPEIAGMHQQVDHSPLAKWVIEKEPTFMANSVLQFKVASFRKIPNPYSSLNPLNKGEMKPQMYVLICDVKNLPSDIPMKTNPRNQDINTKVAKGIKNSLLNPNNRDFYLLNRGLLISAKDVSYNSTNSIVSVTFGDDDIYGDVDGGHTYKVIKENAESLEPNTQFVKVEVLTGVEDIFQDLAEARNRSLQVTDATIANLKAEFNIIKDGFKGMPFENDISYMQNDDKRIYVSDLLAILNLFNIDLYNNNDLTKFPINSYSSKNSCVQSYLKFFKENCNNETKNPYYKMKQIMPDIARLYDQLEEKFDQYYKGDFSKEKHAGAVIGIAKSNYRTLFYDKPVKYSIAKGFLYPIMGAFRALVEEVDGKYVFKKDPCQVLDKIGNMLVTDTIEQSRQLGNNPNATGKNNALWKSLFMETSWESK